MPSPPSFCIDWLVVATASTGGCRNGVSAFFGPGVPDFAASKVQVYGVDPVDILD
jgi:hypothetical protein